jgi:formate dehydrogenase iron-sulfur subunit
MAEYTRKEFLESITAGFIGGVIGLPAHANASVQESNEQSETPDLEKLPPLGILFDITRCIGCLACVRLCKEEHSLPPDIEFELSANSLTVVQKKDGFFMRRLCMHCLTPSCVSVCPVGALIKLDHGSVIWEEHRCIGCRYCMMACPFKVPTYEWWSRNPRIVKCDMCQHRLRKGQEVACAWVCPLGATVFDARTNLLREARRRIDDQPDKYLDHIYGEKEAGGTSTLYLLPKDAVEFGLPDNLGEDPLPNLTLEVLRKIPYVIGTGAVLLGGLWWIINRRMELEELTHTTGQEEEKNTNGTGDPGREQR